MALCTNPFLDAFAARGAAWNSLYGGCLLDAQGARWQPAATASPGHTDPWTLVAAGSAGAYHLPQDVCAALAASPAVGGADSAGRFAEKVAGVVVWKWLGLSADGSAVAVLPDGPNPPPP